jgi:hypothetical protein
MKNGANQNPPPDPGAASAPPAMLMVVLPPNQTEPNRSEPRQSGPAKAKKKHGLISAFSLQPSALPLGGNQNCTKLHLVQHPGFTKALQIKGFRSGIAPSGTKHLPTKPQPNPNYL